MDNKGRLENLLYLLIFVCGAVYAGYHTYEINVLVNPWPIALIGAIAVDGMLGYTLHNIRKWGGDKRIASGFGVLLFLLVSATAQVLYQQLHSALVIDAWARFAATYVIPIASGTGSVAVIALIQFFDDGKATTRKDATPSLQQGLSTAVVKTPEPEIPWLEKVIGPEIVASNGHSEIKRKPGRPPKSVFAKDVDPNSLKP